ncbi:hypothetical protein B0H14DRAFT_3582680 [Mycena olivaceomarginata]|nr:hypothetical protein B0H14DRAFT_3582680 [Mycena olivaceomarginata]
MSAAPFGSHNHLNLTDNTSPLPPSYTSPRPMDGEGCEPAHLRIRDLLRRTTLQQTPSTVISSRSFISDNTADATLATKHTLLSLNEEDRARLRGRPTRTLVVRNPFLHADTRRSVFDECLPQYLDVDPAALPPTLHHTEVEVQLHKWTADSCSNACSTLLYAHNVVRAA